MYTLNRIRSNLRYAAAVSVEIPDSMHTAMRAECIIEAVSDSACTKMYIKLFGKLRSILSIIYEYELTTH
jgi:hypothetical protein